jgi:hypothetical protein
MSKINCKNIIRYDLVIRNHTKVIPEMKIYFSSEGTPKGLTVPGGGGEVSGNACGMSRLSTGASSIASPNALFIKLGASFLTPDKTLTLCFNFKLGALPKQQFLYFFPDPHGQGSFLPGLSVIFNLIF